MHRSVKAHSYNAGWIALFAVAKGEHVWLACSLPSTVTGGPTDYCMFQRGKKMIRVV